MNRADTDIDPVTLEVVRNKLDGIANEMQLTLLRSSFSPIVKEGMDCSAALFTHDGSTLAQATAIPIHLATMIPALAAVQETFPPETMREGDIYLLNDPYCGGTHLPDITLFLPVFAKGRIIAFSVTTVHHQDMGGLAPGSIPTNATEIYQEGLRLPPLKFYDRGEPNETLEKILRLNIRMSDVFMGDLHAQVAACNVGARRFAELAERYGADDLVMMFDELLARSEAMTRTALRTLPDGTYRFEDWLDNDGVDHDQRVHIKVAVTLHDGTIHFDLTGTSPQVRGPINCVPSGARAAAYYAVRALTGSNIPTNGGCFRPVSLELPEGSLVNPRQPAPVNARTATIKRLCGCFVGALAEVVPERVPAASAGLSLMMAFGGKRTDDSPFIVSELVAGGTGGSMQRDGVDCIQTDGTNSMNMPIEAMALEAPIRVTRFALRPDSGGIGKRRGGLGVVREYSFLADDIAFTHRGERHYTSARGACGGGPGAKSNSVVIRADGRVETIPSKLFTRVGRGDRLIVETAGGGGYGNATEREPELVALDVVNGKVSRESAATDYARPEFQSADK